jgi:pimeloyl-ACP methyl ester carboxylesterase
MQKRIKNIFGEDLDLLIEGNENADRILIFVHGFGTDKNEGFSSFLDAAEHFKNNFITIRFDLSGYGESEGEDYEFQFQKAAGDVDSVIRFARIEFPVKEIDVSAHSLGAFIVALLSPSGIKKTVLTSVANSDTEYIVKTLHKRILAKGGKIDENGLTRYPRTSGLTQLIGRDFWRTLRAFKPVEAFEELIFQNIIL